MCDCNCDCDCCVGTIDYSLDYLNSDTQILPQINNSLATNSTLMRYDELSKRNNVLMTFGNVSYGSIVNLEDIMPRREARINIKNLSFGDQHSLMLIETESDDGSQRENILFGYGSNENGELGMNYFPGKKNTYNTWKEVKVKEILKKKNDSTPLNIFWNSLDFDLIDVYTGDKFSLISIKYYKDKVISLYRFQLRKDAKFNSIDWSGEKGTGSDNDGFFDDNEEEVDDQKEGIICITRENFNAPDSGGIKFVSVFGGRILILTNKNYLYIKGTLYDMGNATDYILYKKFNFNIVSLNMGINNCLLLGEDSTIYAIGHNDYNEFGIKEEEVKEQSYRQMANKNGEDPLQKDWQYFENTFFKRNGFKIKKISSGARHSLVLTQDGKVFCFGDNSDGQCCGLEKIVASPSLIRFDEKGEKIIDVQAGFNHSIAKNDKGKVYVWGDSAWDKLGYKETRTDQYNPIEVSDLKIRNVCKLFAGPMQSAFFISGGIGF